MSKYFWGIVIVSSSVGLGAGRVVVDLISEVGKEAKELLSKSSHFDERDSEITPVVEAKKFEKEPEKIPEDKDVSKKPKHVVVSITKRCIIWHTDLPNRNKDPQITKSGDHEKFLSTVRDWWDIPFRIEVRRHCDKELKETKGN